MKERDHFLSKNMVNAPECGKLHLHLSKFSGGEVPDPPPKCPPHSQNAADTLAHDLSIGFTQYEPQIILISEFVLKAYL